MLLNDSISRLESPYFNFSFFMKFSMLHQFILKLSTFYATQLQKRLHFTFYSRIQSNILLVSSPMQHVNIFAFLNPIHIFCLFPPLSFLETLQGTIFGEIFIKELSAKIYNNDSLNLERTQKSSSKESSAISSHFFHHHCCILKNIYDQYIFVQYYF